MSTNRKRILMFGGNSAERFVSVASAQNLARTMSQNGHRAFDILWFISPENAISPTTLEELVRHENPFKIPFVPQAKPVANSIEDGINLIGSLGEAMVFLGFHGTFGEDGKVQALLEKSRIAFTGSGSESSHLCFEKNLAKAVMKKNGFLVAPELLLTAGGTDFETPLNDFFKEHRKIVVKPVANGSSIGLHIISNDQTLKAAVAEIKTSTYGYGKFMAEKFVEGRELTVGITEEGDRTIALPPSEVVLNSGATFDYDGKYLGRGSTEITPAQITEAERQAAEKVARSAHTLLGCFGYSRTDLILTKTGDVYFIETNTLPGLTKASFIPQQLEAARKTVAAFIEAQFSNALKRN